MKTLENNNKKKRCKDDIPKLCKKFKNDIKDGEYSKFYPHIFFTLQAL